MSAGVHHVEFRVLRPAFRLCVGVASLSSNAKTSLASIKSLGASDPCVEVSLLGDRGQISWAGRCLHKFKLPRVVVAGDRIGLHLDVEDQSLQNSLGGRLLPPVVTDIAKLGHKGSHGLHFVVGSHPSLKICCFLDVQAAVPVAPPRFRGRPTFVSLALDARALKKLKPRQGY
jgi:hypothetical protein